MDDAEGRTGETGTAAGGGVVADRLAEIAAALAEFHRRSAHREQVIDRLHEENQELRRGTRRAILEPVVVDLLRLHHSLSAQAGAAAESGGPADLFASFADDVELILERCGAELFRAQLGAAFERGRHSVVSVTPTDDADRHNTVAEVLGAGLVEAATGEVRRPAQARFYKYTPPPAHTE